MTVTHWPHRGAVEVVVECHGAEEKTVLTEHDLVAADKLEAAWAFNADVAKRLERGETIHGVGVERFRMDELPPKEQFFALEDLVGTQEPGCICHRCIREKKLMDSAGMFPLSASCMILCPICGNKRCPHASDHALACTGSNEPGQPGSVYT